MKNLIVFVFLATCVGCGEQYNPYDDRYVDGYGTQLWMTTRGRTGAALESRGPCGYRYNDKVCAGPSKFYTWEQLLVMYPDRKAQIDKARSKAH